MLVKKTRGGLGGLMLAWLASAFSVWITAEVLAGVEVDSFGRAMVVAVVLGLLNALVRPLLIVLTLPVTVITLGLFLVVINGAVLGLAAWLLDGFAIANFWWALAAAVLLSIVSGLMGLLLEPEEEAQRA